jgi:hypothetical protein
MRTDQNRVTMRKAGRQEQRKKTEKKNSSSSAVPAFLVSLALFCLIRSDP